MSIIGHSNGHANGSNGHSNGTNGSTKTPYEKFATGLEVPAPYGTISCKLWCEDGNASWTPGKTYFPISMAMVGITLSLHVGVEKIIALHGWQDNCGTFDELIPLITTKAVIVAVDFPGHGRSSHLPVGIPYSDLK